MLGVEGSHGLLPDLRGGTNSEHTHTRFASGAETCVRRRGNYIASVGVVDAREAEAGFGE